MADYRLYCLNEARKIRTAEWITAGSDEEAIMTARSLKPSSDCELWHSGRMVAELRAPKIEAYDLPSRARHLTPPTKGL
jgi:hypothetical protein